MENVISRYKSGILQVLLCKCPRCRMGDMFLEKNPYKLGRFMKMPETCAVCGQDLNIEVGFYYGTGYVSYGLSVALSLLSFLAWWAIVGISSADNRIYYWLVGNCVLLILLQPLLMRWARSLWIAIFVHYDVDWPNYATEKSKKDMETLQEALCSKN